MAEDRADRPGDGPMQVAQRGQRPELPRRFYKAADFAPRESGFDLVVDGRAVKTPGRRPLHVARRAVIDGLVAEWNAQGERIDPATMPLTRIANSAIDHVAAEMAAVRAEIVKYAASDLVCYRADSPQGLVEKQGAAWDPVIDWTRTVLGARLKLAAGIVHTAQEPAALDAIDAAVAEFDPLALAALSVATTVTGSALLALAIARGRLTPEDAWAAAHVDQDWQMAQWGADREALAVRAARWRDMAAAATILTA
jgi:chaperone required for assembly of F1-ATPase